MTSPGTAACRFVLAFCTTSVAGCGSDTSSGYGFSNGGGIQSGAGGDAASSGGSNTLPGGSSGSSVIGTAGSVGGDASNASAPDAAGVPSDGGAVIGEPIPLPQAVGCLTVDYVKPGVHQVSCDTTIDVVTVPEQCTKTACGVIVDVHGGMMSSQMEDKNTDMSALGMQYGYIVIQPNALQNPLLLNQRLFVADQPAAPADDTRVMDILTDVIEAFHADTNRIHMTGFSEGGFMTWRWYCQHSDLLASVAPGAAAWNCATLAILGLTPPEIGCQFSGTEVPVHHIPALYMIGAEDGLVDPQCSDTWLASNVFPTLGLGPGQQISGDGTYTRTLYLDPDGVPFEYITHQYTTTSSFLGFSLSGHCYPGSTDLTVTPPSQTVIPPDQLISFGCNDQCSFNWGEEVMKFFMLHPKP